MACFPILLVDIWVVYSQDSQVSLTYTWGQGCGIHSPSRTDPQTRAGKEGAWGLLFLLRGHSSLPLCKLYAVCMPEQPWFSPFKRRICRPQRTFWVILQGFVLFFVVFVAQWPTPAELQFVSNHILFPLSGRCYERKFKSGSLPLKSLSTLGNINIPVAN